MTSTSALITEYFSKWDESLHPRAANGEFGSGGEVEFKPSERMQRAMAGYVAAGKREQDIADRSEEVLSKALGIPRTGNNGAFDVRNDDVAIEVKTLVATKHENPKITMNKTALGRKLAEQRAEDLKGYPVVVDRRSSGMTGKAAYYYKEGFGSFRVSSMTRVTLAELREVVRQ